MKEHISVIRFKNVIVYMEKTLKMNNEIHNIKKNEQLIKLILVYNFVYPQGNNLHPPKKIFIPDIINEQDIINKTTMPL